MLLFWAGRHYRSGIVWYTYRDIKGTLLIFPLLVFVSFTLFYLFLMLDLLTYVEKIARKNKISVIPLDAVDRHALDDLLKVYLEATTVFFGRMESTLLHKSQRIFGVKITPKNSFSL